MYTKKTMLTLAISVISSFLLTGCIPPNEHVGKPAAHSYKNDYYYDDDYYYR